MKKIEKKDIWLFGAHVAVWAAVLFALPLATFLSTRDVTSIWPSILVAWGQFQSSIVVYFVNFYLLGPYLFFKRRNWWFVLCNLVLILGLNSGFFMFYFNDFLAIVVLLSFLNVIYPYKLTNVWLIIVVTILASFVWEYVALFIKAGAIFDFIDVICYFGSMMIYIVLLYFLEGKINTSM